jgi:hypothetical protein
LRGAQALLVFLDFDAAEYARRRELATELDGNFLIWVPFSTPRRGSMRLEEEMTPRQGNNGSALHTPNSTVSEGGRIF